MVDLDRGGEGFHSARVYRGPTVGWRENLLVPARIVGDGVTDIVTGDTVILVDGTGAVTLNLPDVVKWWNEYQGQPVAGFDRALTIKSFSGISGIVVRPFGSQTIDKVAGDRIIPNPFEVITLCPLVDLSGWYIYSASGTGGGGPGLFIQSGAGAVVRTMQDKVREQVSVKDFGAKSDGVTDDLVAVNQAISSAAGRTVTFPSGTTTIVSGPIILLSGVTIKSDGNHAATIKTTSATLDIIQINVPAPTNFADVGIDNLIFESSVLKTDGWAINQTSLGGAMYYSRFSNIRMGLNTWSGIRIVCAVYTVLENILVSGLGLSGVGFQFGGGGFVVSEVRIDNCTVDNGRALEAFNIGMLFSDRSEGVYSSRCSLAANIQYGVYFGNPSGDNTLAPKHMFFDKLICDFFKATGIFIEFLLTARFSDCWTTSGTNASGGGINIVAGDDIEFSGHCAINNAGYGLHIGVNAKVIRVLGGVFDVNQVGIAVDANATDFTIVGVDFHRNGSTPSQTAGINIQAGTSNRYVIANNRLIGGTTGGLIDGGSGTNKVIGPNVSDFPIRIFVPSAINSLGTANLILNDVATGGVDVGGASVGVFGPEKLAVLGSFSVKAPDNSAARVWVNSAVGGTPTGTFWNFLSSTGATFIGSIATTDGVTTTYATTSDERLKEDLRPFDAGPLIDAINVYDFAWKGSGKRAHGVVGQQAAEVYPASVTHDEEHDWWGVDYSKYVPILLQELKALRARVLVLEKGGNDA